MDIKRLETMLAKHPFFDGVSPEYVKFVAGCGRNVVFEPDAFILHEGDPADHFYIIRHGSAAVMAYRRRQGSITLQTLHDGDILGGSWLVPPFKYYFDAKALTLVRAVSFDANCLRGRCEVDHELGYQMMQRFATVMTQRLNATRLQLLDVYGVGINV